MMGFPRLSEEHGQDALRAAVVTAVCALFVAFFVANAYERWLGDAAAIWEMSQNTISPSTAWEIAIVPYLYRVLVPFVVGTVFRGAISGFVVVGIAALFACNVLIARTARLYTNDTKAIVFVMVAFSSNLTVLHSGLANICLVDLPALPFVLAAVWLLLRRVGRKDGVWPTREAVVFGAALVLGTLVKESVLFYVPVFVGFFVLRGKWNDAARVFALCLPAVVVHLGIRLWMGPLFLELQRPNPWGLVGGYLELSIGQYRQLFSALGAVWLLIPLALWFCLKQRKHYPEAWLLPTIGFLGGLIMSLMAAEENRYLFFMMFPVLVPALALYLSELNTQLSRTHQHILLLLFFLSRLALAYRPSFEQDTFWPFAHLMAAPGFVAYLTACALLQIGVVAVYVVRGGGFSALRSSGRLGANRHAVRVPPGAS
jgi:hypothetical protein